MMQVWALTGGIACGKSTVLAMLRETGALARSADDDAREAFDDPTVRSALEQAFPDAVAGGTLERSRVAAIVFSDPDRRKQLEGILHPEVRRRMRAAIDTARANAATGILIYEVPLLFEGGLETWFDGVLVVESSLPVRLARLAERARRAGVADDGAARIAAQMPLDEKVARADIVVRNDGDLGALRAEIRRIAPRLEGDEKPTVAGP